VDGTGSGSCPMYWYQRYSTCGLHLDDDDKFVQWTRSGVEGCPHAESQFLGPNAPNKHVDAVGPQHKPH
jgi:hypothetical protein